MNSDSGKQAEYVKRRENEEFYIRMRALNGTPLKTKNVDLISYHLGNWIPPFGIEYVIDKVSIIPVLIISSISFIATIFQLNILKMKYL